MAGNAYVFCAFLDDVIDTDPAYVLGNDGTTWYPISLTIPNPAWIDNGLQTTPDVNGELQYITQVPNPEWDDDGSQTDPDLEGNPRYIPADSDNVSFAQFLIDGVQDVTITRLEKANIQRVNPQFNVEIRRAQVTVALV